MSRESAFSALRWNSNVIVVRDPEELADFRDFLEEFDEDLAKDFDKRIRSWTFLEDISPMNGIDPEFFILEVHDEGEYGCQLTFSGAENYEDCRDYYGVDLIEMSDLV